MGGSYSSSYDVPAKKLVEDVQKIREVKIDVLLPFTIHRNSKLTSDSEGYNIWLDVCNFVFGVTNKVIQHKKTKDSKGNLLPYNITDRYLFIPEGDVEAAIHDMCHWIVAGIKERWENNCGMDRMSEELLIEKEELAWTLETWIFSAVIGEPELVDLVSPHAEIETFHYWVRVNDPTETTIRALQAVLALPKTFNITLLRRILASWV